MSPPPPKLSFGSNSVPFVPSVKFLDPPVGTRLLWKPHFQWLCIKSWLSLNILEVLSSRSYTFISHTSNLWQLSTRQMWEAKNLHLCISSCLLSSPSFLQATVIYTDGSCLRIWRSSFQILPIQPIFTSSSKLFCSFGNSVSNVTLFAQTPYVQSPREHAGPSSHFGEYATSVPLPWGMEVCWILLGIWLHRSAREWHCRCCHFAPKFGITLSLS
jgi:hypothetical protein